MTVQPYITAPYTRTNPFRPWSDTDIGQEWCAATTTAMAALPYVKAGDTVYVGDGNLHKWLVIPANSLTIGDNVINGTVASVQFLRDGVQLATSTTDGLMPHGLVAQLSKTGVTVAGLPALKALTGIVGESVTETTIGDTWEAREAATATADDVMIVNATDGSVQWFRIPGTERSKWLAFWIANNVYVNGSTGNDWNTGDSTHPLATADEIDRRLGDIVSTSNLSIYLQTAVDHIALRMRAITESLALSIYGTATQQLATTIASYAPYSHGTYGGDDPVPTKITANGISSWTTYASSRLRLRSGTKISWIDTPCPDGFAPYATNIASTSLWYDRSVVAPPLYKDLSVGDPLVLESLSTIGDMYIAWNGEVDIWDATLTGNMRFPSARQTNRWYCYIASSAKDNTPTAIQYGNGVNGCRMESNNFDSPLIVYGGYAYNMTLEINSFDGFDGITDFLSRVTTSASAGTYNFGHFGIGDHGWLRNVMAFQHSNANIIRWGDNVGSTDQPRSLGIQGFSCVSDQQCALALAIGTRLIIYRTGATFNPVTKTATAGDFGLNAVGETRSSGAFMWGDIAALSAIPFLFEPGVWKGTVTLQAADAGQKTVTLSPAIPALFTSDVRPKIWLDVRGSIWGVPSNVSQTTSSFTFATAADDNSTYSYEIRSNYLQDIYIWVR